MPAETAADLPALTITKFDKALHDRRAPPLSSSMCWMETTSTQDGNFTPTSDSGHSALKTIRVGFIFRWPT